MIYLPLPQPPDWTHNQMQYLQALTTALFEAQAEIIRLKTGHQECLHV